MKKYSKPEIEKIILADNDVICVSVESINPEGRSLTTNVAGNEGTDYGSDIESIFK